CSALTSSKLNRTPPIGAPNATEIAAAADADKISRFFASFFPYFGKNFAIMFPTQQHTCTMGPSLPTHSPLEVDSIIPKLFTTNTRLLRNFRNTKPLKMHLI